MPALVTFHERLMADEAIHASIRAALGIDTEDASYDGRRPRSVRQALEFLVEQVEAIPQGRGGAHQVHEHRYTIRVFLRSVGSADRSGKAQIDTLTARLRALVAAFDLARPWQAVLGAVVLHTEAKVTAVDDEPNDVGQIEGRVALSVFTRGTGDDDGTQSPGG